MTNKQRIQWNAMREALKDIAGSDSTDKLRKQSKKLYGLDYNEALEMAYENVQQLAKDYVRGVKYIPDPLNLKDRI
jgi:hypothetical protein